MKEPDLGLLLRERAFLPLTVTIDRKEEVYPVAILFLQHFIFFFS